MDSEDNDAFKRQTTISSPDLPSKQELAHHSSLKEAESYLKSWRRTHVDYARIFIDPYTLTQKDRDDSFFRDIIEETQYAREQLCDDVGGDPCYCQMLTKYNENYDTEDKYLRVLQRM